MVNIEALFPGLVGTSYRITSSTDDVYKCIAWAAGCTTDWWWPSDEPGVFWPEGVAKTETIQAFQEAFTILGYTTCKSAEPETGYEKVAIFQTDEGCPTHAARQLPNGLWTSNLGKLEDIEHELPALVGIEYDVIGVIMRQPIQI